MSQESFNNNDGLRDAPGAGQVIVPEWAREYAARQAEQRYAPDVAPQIKAENTQPQPVDNYELYVQQMHARGRMIDWMGDQYSRRQQNDWYPGYGPGNGYYYPVRSMSVAPTPYTPIQYYPQQGSRNNNQNNPGQYNNGGNPFNNFPGQNGGGAYNWSNPGQYNNGNPFANWNNPGQTNNGGNPFNNFPGQNGTGAYNWSNPAQYNTDGNPSATWNNGMPGANPGNPFYNWRNQGPTDQPATGPFQQDYLQQPDSGNREIVGMSMQVGPDGRQYTYNYVTGEQAPWTPQPQQQQYSPDNYYQSPGRYSRPGRQPRPGDGNAPQPVGMSMRIGPDGRQYTYNYVTGEQAPWTQEPYSEQPRSNNYEQLPNGFRNSLRPQQPRQDQQFRQFSNLVTPATVEHWNRSNQVIRSMVGHSIQDYDRSIPERLGCARFVSVVLNRADGLPTRDATVEGLESSLQRFGFRRLPLSQAKPGDVIIAHRYGDEPGHAAMYVGNGKVANNSSRERRVAIQEINKFNSPEYKSVYVYRRV